MSRLDKAWGSHDPDVLFGGAPITSVPWPQAGRKRDQPMYNKERVNAAVLARELTPTDPRNLHATQGQITYAGVQHYLKDDSGTTYKDPHKSGNRDPVVYHKNGDSILLSGHHRAAKALLRGEQFNAVHAHEDK